MEEYEMVNAFIVMGVWVVVATCISYFGSRYLMRNESTALHYDGPCPALIGLAWPIIIVVSPILILVYCVTKAQEMGERR